MNGKEVARRLRVPYRTALDLLQSGTITSRKEKGVWVAEAATVQRVKRGNDRKLEKLRSDYVRLYWEGLSPDQLQARVRDDMALRGIVCTVSGFAEQAIYADLMKERNTTRDMTTVPASSARPTLRRASPPSACSSRRCLSS